MQSFFPEPTAENKQLAKKAFLKLWAAGTVGGFLATLARSVPHDFAQRSLDADWCCTSDLILRYLYLVLLIAYFFLSNLRIDFYEVTGPLIFYDVVQTIAAFAAVFGFDSVVPGAGFTYAESSSAFALVNLAFVWICGGALLLFRHDGWRINVLRGIGLVVSLAAMLACHFQNTGPLGPCAHTVTVIAVVVLSLLLWPYGLLRICELEK